MKKVFRALFKNVAYCLHRVSSSGGVTGGIAANIKSGASLSNVASNVNITHTAGSNNGGIVGLILDKGTYTIENCSYNGTFTGTKSDNIGGILGALLAVPVCAVLYALFREAMDKRQAASAVAESAETTEE